MRFILALLPLAVAPLAAAQLVQSAAPQSRLARDCLEQADPYAQGLDALEAECPGVTEWLAHTGQLTALSQAQRERLSAENLAQLAQLSTRMQSGDSSPPLRTADLQTILKSLEQGSSDEEMGWFARFKAWLRGRLEGMSSEADPRWLKWFEELSLDRAAVDVLIYAIIALVNIAAIVVLIVELRAAGVLRSGRRTQHEPNPQAALGAAPSELTAADVERADVAQRPSLLLQLLIAGLERAGRLHAGKSATHRELIARTRFDSSDEQQGFAALASLAERVVYGRKSIPAPELEPIMRRGWELHAKLSGRTA